MIGLGAIAILQKKLSSVIPLVDEKYEKPKPQKIRLILYPALLFVVTPLISVIVGSFRIQDRTKRGTYFWGLDGWKRAINGSYAHTDIIDATMQSLVYASMTVIIAVPLGLLITKSLIELEKKKQSQSSNCRNLSYASILYICRHDWTGNIDWIHEMATGFDEPLVDSSTTSYYDSNSICHPNFLIHIQVN